MKKLFLATTLLVAGLATGGVLRAVRAAEKPPKPSTIKQYTIDQFLNTTSIFGSSFSHDEKLILFSSNKTGIYNAYTIPVTGGEAKPLTYSTTDSIFALSFFPHDNRVLYRSDRGGNEIHHLYVRNEDGSVQELTPDEQARAVFYGWAHDEKSFFFGWNRRDPKFMDVYEMDIKSFTSTLVYQNDPGYEFAAVSNNKRYLAFTKPITTNNAEMYLYDRETQELKHLSPHEGEVNYEPQEFSPDSKSLYYLTDEGREFAYLKRYDLESGKSAQVAEAPWDIMFIALSRSGRYRVLAINHDARTEIRLLDTVENRLVKLPQLPAGEITSVNIAKSEKRMAFYHSGSRSPNDLYVYDLEGGKYTRMTNNLNPEIDPEDLVEAKVVRYSSFDGLEIPAVYYQPHQASRESKVVGLVWVHGGPGGQSRVGYSGVIQYLVNHGYAVLAVNNRGSSGYGKTFYAMDDRKHGEVDLDDCVEAKKFLAATGVLDEKKIGILGGSYGGYMVLAALTFRPQAFAVGVDLFGISNWVRTLESVPPWWEAFREALYKELGDPATDKDYLHRISPLFHSDQIERPLMVLQGANDPRVLKVESDDIVAAVKEKGVPVEYLVFDDEGHGFVKKENQIKGYRAVREFLDRYLKGEPGK